MQDPKGILGNVTINKEILVTGKCTHWTYKVLKGGVRLLRTITQGHQATFCLTYPRFIMAFSIYPLMVTQETLF